MLTILENEPLALYTTFKIGGPADYFVRVKTKEELIYAIKWANKKGRPFFIIGAGSNLLIGDKGFRGLIIKNEMDSIQLVAASGSYSKEKSKEQKVFVKADGGVLVNRLVRYMLGNSYSGLENFLGQPGTVGGAVYINAHNMKTNDFFSQHLTNAEIVNDKGESKVVDKKYLQFGYDQSQLQEDSQYVTWVVVEGCKKNEEEMRMVWKAANESVSYRQQSQPYGFSTAGCIFRNIADAEAVRLKTPNQTTSAGYLIEQAGLKGRQIGQAAISNRHANFIVNLGGAKAVEILELVNLIKHAVWEKFKVDLKLEIVKVGEF